jgi:transcriptional regulator with XRE-family HTH domain
MGRRVREAREMVEGLSARELSDLAGLTDSHVGLVESGRIAELKLGTIDAIATALGVSTTWLATGDGAGPKPSRVRAAVLAARAARDARDASRAAVG